MVTAPNGTEKGFAPQQVKSRRDMFVVRRIARRRHSR